jgi:nicotinamidase-related amidase
MSQAGPVEEPVTLQADRTALVGMHCWNIGCTGGPPVDDAFYVGMGFPAAHRLAGEIMRERILPAMDAARRAGVLVAHVESGQIGEKHRDLMEVPPTVTRFEIEGDVPPPAVPGHSTERAWRAHGRNYPTSPPYATMDRVSFLMPREGEPFAVDSVQLHRVLHKRGIENLVYTGFATDMCVLHSPGGIVEMETRFSYRVFLIREATLGVEFPDRFEQRASTQYGMRLVESHYGHTIAWDEWMRQCEALATGEEK